MTADVKYAIITKNENNRKEPDNMKEYSKKKSFWTLVGALMLVIASTALLVTKYFEDKAHYEKWKDYEECGI